jgi:hypothetical protein
MNIADRIEQLAPADAEWAARLFVECLRARTHEAELMSGPAEGDAGSNGNTIEAQLAQVALDAAEWLKTLWNVGYMGAGSFPSQPRSAFPLVELEDVLKSALFARIRQGKRPLPFPPPTRHGLPWHDLLESQDETHAVHAEIVRDGQHQAIGAIIDGCANWNIVEEVEIDREYLVQHRGKGPFFRLQFEQGVTTLRREPPRWTRRILSQERGGFRSYTLEWPQDDGKMQSIPLRAATWERAESEADYWIASTHPEMYGQMSFERVE